MTPPGVCKPPLTRHRRSKSRTMTNRFVIKITAADGSESLWGSWRDSDTAEHLAAKLRDVDGYGVEFRVTVQYVERWPGLAKAKAELQ
jgi:hypothetical protein